MAVVRLGPNGEVEVIEPPTPEEMAEAEDGLRRVIRALVRLAEEDELATRTEPPPDPQAP